MIKDVFDTLALVCGRQDFVLGDAIQEDAADRLIVKIVLRDLEGFLSDVRALTTDTTAVTLTLSLDEYEDTLVRTPQGDWRMQSAGRALGDLLPAKDVRDTWSPDELTGSLSGRSVLAAAKLDVDKKPWRAEIEASTGRSTWIGHSESSFEGWLQSRTWRQVANELFNREGGLVLFYEWENDPVKLGDRLVARGLDGYTAVRTLQLQDVAWPQAVEPAFVRAAHLVPPSVTDRPWVPLLLRVAAICATRLFDSATGLKQLRESGDLPPAWDLDEDLPVEIAGLEGVLALVRWTSAEPTGVRLAIAWRIAADRINNPLRGPSAASLEAAADIAYDSTINSGVRASLSRQVELERSFRDIDSSVASSRESMISSVDATVTRALAAVVATGIAAVTSDAFRGWPIVAASALIGAYLLFQATFVLASQKGDIHRRLRAFDLLVSERGHRLAQPLSTEISEWRVQLNGRVRSARVGLALLAVVVLVGGVVAAVTSGTTEGDGNNGGSGTSASFSPSPPRADQTPAVGDESSSQGPKGRRSGRANEE